MLLRFPSIQLPRGFSVSKSNVRLLFLVLGVVIGLAAARTQAQEQVLHSFGEDENGAYPISSIVRDAQGNLYGTTNLAGIGGQGTVFELTPQSDGTWTYTLLHGFN